MVENGEKNMLSGCYVPDTGQKETNMPALTEALLSPFHPRQNRLRDAG